MAPGILNCTGDAKKPFMCFIPETFSGISPSPKTLQLHKENFDMLCGSIACIRNALFLHFLNSHCQLVLQLRLMEPISTISVFISLKTA